MAEDIVFNASIDPGGTGAKSLASLKKEFMELQQQLTQTQEGTAEYQAALERLGAVKDDIGDLRDTISALNPEGKIAAFANVAGKLAGGFQAATGAAALFGAESEELEKQLLKVQAATAFAQGIQSIVGMGDAFRVLATVIKSNPIFLMATVIAGIVTAVTLLTEAFKDNAKTVEKLTEENEKLKKSYEDVATAIDNQIKLSNAYGLDQIKVLELQALKQEELVKSLNKQRNVQIELMQSTTENRALSEKYYQNIVDLEKKIEQATVDGAAAILQIEKIRAERATKARDEEKKASEARVKEFQSMLDANLKSQQEYDAFILEEQKKAHDLEIEEAKRVVEYKKAENEFLQQYLIKSEEDENQRAEQNKERRKKDIDELTAKEKEAALEQAAARSQAVDQGFNASKALSDAYFNEELSKQRTAKNNRDSLINEQYQNEINQARYTGKLTAQFKDEAEKRRVEALQNSAKAELAIRKKQFEVDKAFSIARAVIDGVRAVQAALTIPPPAGLILAAANGILAAANIAKIASTKFDPGNVSIPSALPTPNATAPTISPAPQVQPTTQLNQDGTVRQGTQLTRAYVVESDITDKQRAISRIERQSKF